MTRAEIDAELRALPMGSSCTIEPDRNQRWRGRYAARVLRVASGWSIRRTTGGDEASWASWGRQHRGTLSGAVSVVCGIVGVTP